MGDGCLFEVEGVGGDLGGGEGGERGEGDVYAEAGDGSQRGK